MKSHGNPIYFITSTLRRGCHEAGQMAIRSTLDPPRPHAAGTPQRTDSGGAGPAAAAMGRVNSFGFLPLVN